MSYFRDIDIEHENRVRLKAELEKIEETLKNLEIPIYGSGLGFCTGSKLITVALKDHVSANGLAAIQKVLVEHSRKGRAPIDSEAYNWLESACEHLDQFSSYCDELVDKLYARKEEIEHELDSTEQTQSEMDKEAGESLDKRR